MWCKPGLPFLGGGAIGCCLLLELGGANELLLESDSGCLELEDCP